MQIIKISFIYYWTIFKNLLSIDKAVEMDKKTADGIQVNYLEQTEIGFTVS